MQKFIGTILGCCLTLLSWGQENSDTLLVGYTNAPPFIIESEDGSLDGINLRLWSSVAEELNLNYKLVPMGFAPMLKGLEEGNIDVSINPLTITSARSKKIDFSQTFFATNSSIVINEHSSFEKFIQVVRSFFTVNFLRGLLILLLIVGLFGLLTWLFEKRGNPEQFRPGIKGLWDGLWWSAVTVTTVGYGDKAPKSGGGQVIALIWMFTSLLFISGLTASVASSLTINELNASPKGLHSFKDDKVGSLKDTETIDYLRDHFFRNVKEFENVESGLEAVKANEIEAFLYDEPILRYRLDQNKTFSNLQVLPMKFDLQFYAFGLSQERLKLKDEISLKILEFIETAEWQIILNEYNLSEL